MLYFSPLATIVAMETNDGSEQDVAIGRFFEKATCATSDILHNDCLSNANKTTAVSQDENHSTTGMISRFRFNICFAIVGHCGKSKLCYLDFYSSIQVSTSACWSMTPYLTEHATETTLCLLLVYDKCQVMWNTPTQITPVVKLGRKDGFLEAALQQGVPLKNAIDEVTVQHLV